MGSTNKTAHYELPQFVANDKPSWLGDVNEAMEAIDTGIYGAKSSADGAQQTANNAVAGVSSAGTRMDGIQTQLDTVATQANQTATTVTQHTSSIATNSANINTINSRLGSTDISSIGDGTVTGAISAISAGGGGGTGLQLVKIATGSGSTNGAKADSVFNAIDALSDTELATCIILAKYSGATKPTVFHYQDYGSGAYKFFEVCSSVGFGGFSAHAIHVKASGSETGNGNLTAVTDDSTATTITSLEVYALQ